MRYGLNDVIDLSLVLGPEVNNRYVQYGFTVCLHDTSVTQHCFKELPRTFKFHPCCFTPFSFQSP